MNPTVGPSEPQSGIFRSVLQMIDLYGDDAGIQAALRADHLLDQGDPDGFHLWKRIVDAINELQQAMPN